MSCLQINRSSQAAFESIAPARDADAPFVAWFESGKPPFRNRRDQVVAIKHGKIEKIACHFHADRMKTDIFRPGATKSIPVKTGQRVATAALQFGPENICWHSD